VGQAIADYLRHGRPATSDRHMFFRAVALIGLHLTGALH